MCPVRRGHRTENAPGLTWSDGEARRADSTASQKHRTGTVLGSSTHPEQAGPRFDRRSLDRQSLRIPSPVKAAFKKALKAKETGPVPKAKVTRS